MAVVYAVVNQKGGVGKTTTAVNISAYLALSGARVLVVDTDPQGNATSGLGIRRSNIDLSVYDVLVNGRSVRDCVMSCAVENLDVLPATLELAAAEVELMPRISRETVLRNALTNEASNYDYVITDAPPSLGLLTLNALCAADALILPIQTEYFALEGISHLVRTIEMVRQHINPQLEVAMVILTMADTRTKLAQQVAEEVLRHFNDRVSSTQVPRNIRLSEAPSHGLPIALYDPKSRGALAYKKLAQELLIDGETRSRKRTGGSSVGISTSSGQPY